MRSMFRVNLGALDRAGKLLVEGDIPPDAPLWEGMDPTLVAPLRVTLELSATAGGQLWARGEMETALERECRRCLEPVEHRIRETLDLVWITPDDHGDEEDGEVRVISPDAAELDLEPVIREEFLLAVPLFVLCGEECLGLCPQCGVNRNIDDCECTLEEPDPRWEALRSLKRESE